MKRTSRPIGAMTLGVLALLCAQGAHGQSPGGKGLPFPAEMRRFALERRGVWKVEPGELMRVPWWTMEGVRLNTDWWESGGRAHYEAIASFRYHERAVLLPRLINGYGTQAGLERVVALTGRMDEFERRRALAAQLELMKQLPRVDWAGETLLGIEAAGHGAYDFTKKGYLVGLTGAGGMYLQRHGKEPECGVLLPQDMAVLVKVLSSEVTTPAKLGKDAAVQVQMQAKKLFISLSEVVGEEWAKKYEAGGYVLSWITPVMYFATGGGRELAGVCGLLCKVRSSALYLRKKGEVDNFALAVSWTEGQPGFEPVQPHKETFLPENLLPLK